MKKLAVLGPKNTYSDRATKNLETNYEIKYYPNILEVICHIDDETDALVPFENTLDGFVMESLDGILKTNSFIHFQTKLNVDFNFASYEHSMDEVKEVYVQFKAYGQCQDFILNHRLTPLITQSNMESLQLLQKRDKTSVGAILPIYVDTKEYPLVFPHILGKIQDETRFVLLSKEKPIFKAEHVFSCSVAITPKVDKAGVLYSILKCFNDKGINLKAILSRPRKDIIGNYIFYIEFNLRKEDESSLREIKMQIEETCDFSILGFYNLL